MAKIVLEVKNLTKIFGKTKAVDNVSFKMRKGEILGLLGPNGAGKTTTIQMLLTTLTPTTGVVRYFGESLSENREMILQRINYTSGYSRLPWRMTVAENLLVYAHLYQVNNYKKKIEELLEIFQAKSLKNKSYQNLSAGQKTRVSLIKAFVNDPEIILLDEPTASLDPDIADRVRRYILSERTKRNISILITSHNMKEVEEMCDRVVFLHKGKVLAVDTPYGLARKNKESRLNLMIKDGLKRTMDSAQKHGYKFDEQKRFITINLPEKEIASFLTELGERGVSYDDIEIVRPNLEDFFLSVSKEKLS